MKKSSKIKFIFVGLIMALTMVGTAISAFAIGVAPIAPKWKNGNVESSSRLIFADTHEAVVGGSGDYSGAPRGEFSTKSGVIINNATYTESTYNPWRGNKFYFWETAIANATVTLNFSTPQKIQDMLIWNYNHSGAPTRGFKDVKIEYSLDGETWSVLGTATEAGVTHTFSSSLNTAFNGGVGAKVDTTIAVNQEITKIRIKPITNYGDAEFTGLGKVAFVLQDNPDETTKPEIVSTSKMMRNDNFLQIPYTAIIDYSVLRVEDGVDVSACPNVPANDFSKMFNGIRSNDTWQAPYDDKNKNYQFDIKLYDELSISGINMVTMINNTTADIPTYYQFFTSLDGVSYTLISEKQYTGGQGECMFKFNDLPRAKYIRLLTDCKALSEFEIFYIPTSDVNVTAAIDMIDAKIITAKTQIGTAVGKFLAEDVNLFDEQIAAIKLMPSASAQEKVSKGAKAFELISDICRAPITSIDTIRGTVNEISSRLSSAPIGDNPLSWSQADKDLLNTSYQKAKAMFNLPVVKKGEVADMNTELNDALTAFKRAMNIPNITTTNLPFKAGLTEAQHLANLFDSDTGSKLTLATSATTITDGSMVMDFVDAKKLESLTIGCSFAAWQWGSRAVGSLKLEYWNGTSYVPVVMRGEEGSSIGADGKVTFVWTLNSVETEYNRIDFEPISTTKIKISEICKTSNPDTNIVTIDEIEFGFSVDPNNIAVELDKNAVTMNASQTDITLTATIEPYNVSNKTIIWSSSNAALTVIDGKIAINQAKLESDLFSITVRAVSSANTEKFAECVITVNLDRSLLKTALDEANLIIEKGTNTQGSYDAFILARTNADTVYKKVSTTQDKLTFANLDKAIKELQAAQKNLQPKGDAATLKALWLEIKDESLAAADYSKNSFDEYKRLFNLVKDYVLDDGGNVPEIVDVELTQIEIDKLIADYNIAKLALVSIKDLSTLFADANLITEQGLYSKATYDAFVLARTETSEVLAKVDCTQNEVNAAIDNLTAAKNALVTIGDLTELRAYLTTIGEIDSHDYTTVNFEAFNTIYVAAKGMLAIENSQESIDSTLVSLKAAYAKISLLGDVTLLSARLTEIGVLDSALYTSTINAYNEFVTTLTAIITASNSSVNEVANYKTQLDQLFASLKLKGDLQALTNLYNSAKDYAQADYSAGFDQLQTALANANGIISANDSDQVTIDASLSALQTAINNLVKVVVKADLQAKYDELVKITNQDYTSESWNSFSAVVTAAKTVLDDANATQDKVNKALTELNQAFVNLQKQEQKQETGCKSSMQTTTSAALIICFVGMMLVLVKRKSSI